MTDGCTPNRRPSAFRTLQAQPPAVRLALVAGFLIALTVIGFALRPNGSPSSGPQAPAVQGVQWRDYAGDLQSRIDGLAARKDCGGLQREFDIADAKSAETRQRTGHNNAELMEYLDNKMRGAGCY
jgi:hypothetical protein